jgi:hypothetical protein
VPAGTDPSTRRRRGCERALTAAGLRGGSLLFAGCGGGAATGGLSPAESFDRAVEELASGQSDDDAREHLLSVWRRCGVSPLGERALLLYVAESAVPTGVQEEGDPAGAAAAAARLIRTPGRSVWADRMARALYLSALDLSPTGAGQAGAALRPSGHAENCSVEDSSLAGAGEPPALGRRALGVRFRALRMRADSLAREVERLRKLLEGSGGTP